LHMATYLKRRGDEKVFDWSSLNANTKNYEEGRAVAMKNWENKLDTRSDGIAEKMQMREVMRTMILKVMYENDIDVFVNPTITVPPAKNGHAAQPQVNDRPLGRFPLSANAAVPEVTVPAGFNQIIFEPVFALNEKKDNYVSVANETKQTMMDAPMPFGISFWGGPGDEPVVLKIAATYEAATKHRAPPPAFGPLKRH
jgi:amidase